MVIYEVNLAINNEIYHDYYDYLIKHVKEMLLIEGFKKAEIGIIEQAEADRKKRIRVCYSIDSYSNLQKYLANEASAMRAQTLQKFGDQFSANRRVITETVVLTNPNLD